ncbi:T9SS type A sorting domain-containing protein [Aquimarina sp. MMG015]|uniref:T9SS type A sorting domain-containing protein n=1 Tax=Aquimarina sp. MMG015 TaxID=2822689 RepID=UPI001B39FA27|nr:T9SS type A sorting domain-containing protein [Aquimarina sp. MMG015]MBQ4804369.1 T9SS type A sorting domain-containing protein [Aquimarina sp. MMG015]
MKKTPFLIIATLSCCLLTAQNWRNSPSHDESNYFDIVREKRQEYSSINKSRTRVDRKKIKQFERWAYYWERRINEDGTFPDPMKTYNEWDKYQENNPIQKNTNNANWTLVGPKVIPDSETTFYAGMGRLNVVTFNPNDLDEIWVGSPGGGVWRSNDFGNNWMPKGDNIPNLGVSDIVFDPTNSDIMYLATGDFDGFQNNSIGVLKSTDHGESWQTTGLNYEVKRTRQIAHLLIDPNNTNTIFATTDRGIYKSTDAGANWVVKTATARFNDIMYKEGSTSTLFATNGSSTNFYISTDNGETWTTSSTGLTNGGRFDIATTASNPEFLMGMNNGTIYRSTDGGTSWSTVSSPATLSTQGGYNQTILIAPDDANLVIVGGVDGWRSTDGGSSWEKYLDGYWVPGTPFFYVHSDHHDLEFLPGSSTEVFSANDGGLFVGNIRTNDPWLDLSSGLSITQYYKVAGTPQNADFLLAGAQDNDITQYNGIDWINRNYGSDGVEALWNYSDSNVAYTCSQVGYVERTTDGWATRTTALNTPRGARFVWPLEIDPTDPNTIYGGFGNIYSSSNSGDDWTNMNSPGGAPTAITIAPSNNQVLYVTDGNGVYTTANGGTDWNTLTLPVAGNVTSIAVNSTDPTELYICYGRYNDGNKVFRSNNSGTTWENISGTLPNVPMHKILFLTGGDGDLFLGSDIGVFHRNNTGTDWQIYGQGLPNVISNDLEVHYGTDKLRVATYGRGVWEVSIASNQLGIGEFEDPNVLTIFPNPSNGVFTLKLVDFNNESEITIYNIIGGVVKSFKTNEITNTVDLSSYSAGVYLVDMRNNNKRIVKRVILK